MNLRQKPMAAKDNMSLTPEEQIELDAINKELARRTQQVASFKAPTSFADYATRPSNDAYAPNAQVLRDAAHVLDVGLEGGIPLAAQVLSLGNPYVTGIAGGVGNTLAQTRRMMFSGQKDFNVGEALNATLVNAIPIVGPEANVARMIMKPGKVSVALDAAKEASKFAAGMYAGKTIETSIDKGRFPNAIETALSVGAPAALGGASVVGSLYGDRIMKQGKELASTYEALKQFGKENLTPGSLMPSTFAKIESQLTEVNQSIRNKVDNLYSKIEDGLRSIVSTDTPIEGATLSAQINERSKKIAETERHFATLGQEVIEADKALAKKTSENRLAIDKFNGLNRDRIREQSLAVQTQTDLDAQANFNRAMGVTVDNAIEIASQKIAGSVPGSIPLNPAQARNGIVDKVTKPLEAAYDATWKRRYGTFDQDIVGFDTSSLQSKLEKMKSESRMTSEAKGEIDGLINNLKGEDGNMVSMGKLRDIRSGLFNASGTASEQRVSKGYAKQVSELMDNQIENVFPRRGDEFKSIQKDYAKYSDLWEMPGVEMFFVKNPADDLVTKTVAGIKKSGIDSDEYKNITALITHIAGGTMSTPNDNANFLLASSLKGHVNDLIRSNIIMEASEGGRVSTEKLLKILSPDNIDDKTLRTLGFGSKNQLRDLALLTKKNPDYSSLSPEDLAGIFSSESFKAAADGRSGSKLATLAQDIHRINTIKDKLIQSAMADQLGLKQAAAAAYEEAKAFSDKANLSRDNFSKAVAEVKSNPVYQNFGQIGSNSWNGFISEVLDPKSAKVNDKFVKELVDSLKNSPDAKDNQLLKAIQQRYVEDHLKKMKPTEAGALITEQVDFGQMANLTKPRNMDFERAKSLLAPDQLKALEEFSVAAKAMYDYEAIGGIASRPPSRNLPVKQQIRKSIDGVLSIANQGNYNEAAALLLNPESYRDKLFYKGEIINSLVDPKTVRSALNVTNFANRMINQTDEEKANAANAANAAKFNGRR